MSAHDLTPCTWDPGIEDKGELINGYRTQVDAMFPAGRIPGHLGALLQQGLMSGHGGQFTSTVLVCLAR